jgi:hypothetical protein
VSFSATSCLFETEKGLGVNQISVSMSNIATQRFGNYYVLEIVVGKDMVEVSVRAGGKGVAANEDVFTNC